MTNVDTKVSDEAVADSDGDGWPYRALPSGWFQVAWSEELAPGDVKALRYFRADQVLYRGMDGTAVVLDAHCPHMGAHLGHGGTVEECAIRCPFHGWKWGADGKNLDVPSEGTATNRRQARSWPVVEVNGCILVWHDELRRSPFVEPPPDVSGEAEFLPIYPHCAVKYDNVRARPQYVAENTVDVDHLRWIHRNPSPAQLTVQKDHGSAMEVELRWIAGYGRERTWLTPEGPTEYIAHNMLYGPGIIVARYSGDDSVLFQTATPVDQEHSDFFMTVFVRQDMEADGADGPIPVGNALSRVEEQSKQLGRDLPVWANMRYATKPAYTKSEGKPFVAMRRWMAQFYPA